MQLTTTSATAILLIVFFFSFTQSTTTNIVHQCSSLAGSQCLFINSLEPPRYVRGLTTLLAEESKNNDINILLAALRSLPTKKKINATGSFRVSANLFEDMSFQIYPVEWISKPGPSWVMVGFYGELQSPYEDFDASIYDDSSADEKEMMQGCSPLYARRVLRGMPEIRASLSSRLEGKWEGYYSCHGVETLATLILARSGTGNNDQAAKLAGVFQFHAEKK